MLEKLTTGSPRRVQRRSFRLFCLVGALCIAPFSIVNGQFGGSGSLKTTKSSTLVSTREATTPSKPSLKVFRLKVADAVKTGEILKQVLGSGSGYRVAADPKTNSLVVFADEQMITQIGNVIQNLDQIDRNAEKASTELRVVTVFALKYAKASELDDMLLRLYGNPSFGTIKFATDERSNSVIVTTPSSRVNELRSLVTRIDVPKVVDPSKQVILRIFPLKNSEPKEILHTVGLMIKGDDLEYIGIDSRTKSLIVRATEEKCNEIMNLINILDREKP